MIILPTTYMGSVARYARIASGEACAVDLGEHFIKRSERNRARILAAGGVMELTLHVQHGNRPRTPVRDLRIDYSKRWQHQHWESLVAAYKGSPYFDHYAGWFEPFYRKKWDFLVDFNLEMEEMILQRLRIAHRPQLVDTYIEATAEDLDLRPKRAEDPAFVAAPYVQVFSDRHPFAPNLSIADLLFAEGPASAEVLRASLRRG